MTVLSSCDFVYSFIRLFDPSASIIRRTKQQPPVVSLSNHPWLRLKEISESIQKPPFLL